MLLGRLQLLCFSRPCSATGMDVARKVVILARECGLQIGLEDLEVSSLVPEELAALSTPQEYMDQLHKVSVNAYFIQPDCGLEMGLVCLEVFNLAPQGLAALASPQEYMEQLHKLGGSMSLRSTCCSMQTACYQLCATA